ncbi:hypothetical protein HF086_009163 [Spodoptera exigua]|uniref:Secreted protein n=1 Tax=Spodoptera exigua TaxID=7107 RepID=A0A922MX43_SPOEX|nr:hypothetical protein HF086_009163 [Spodoptera exigua]
MRAFALLALCLAAVMVVTRLTDGAFVLGRPGPTVVASFTTSPRSSFTALLTLEVWTTILLSCAPPPSSLSTTMSALLPLQDRITTLAIINQSGLPDGVIFM